MRDSRQLTVLRSLFRTLHPTLTSGLKNGLAPAKRLFTDAYQRSDQNAIDDTGTSENDTTETVTLSLEERAANKAAEQAARSAATARPETVPLQAPDADSRLDSGASERAPLPPLPRSLTDEHLVTELERATSQFDLQRAGQTRSGQKAPANLRTPGRPARGRRHFSRDSLLSLLEEAKVRIQVLETELEMARGTEEQIPLLTDEWAEDMPSTHSRKPD